MNESPRILIACVGNIFLGDDAFGVEVARQLTARRLPPEVRIVDFGIRGIDLMYALLDLSADDTAILVDAVPQGEPPGTLCLIKPDPPPDHLDLSASQDVMIQAHSMDPAKVLTVVGSMGGKIRNIYVVGCQPDLSQDDQDMDMSLSPAVQAAIMPAIEMIESVIAKLKGADAHERSLNACR